MLPKHRRALLVFCLLGLGASLFAAYVHYRMLLDPSYRSLCDVSATVSCQGVYQSAYGSFLGVPISIFGTLWFALATLLVAFAGPPPVPVQGKGRSREREVPPASAVPGYLFVMSTAALAVVLYLAYASFFVLNMVCIACLLTYVAVIGVFLVSGAAMTSGVAALPGRAAGDVRRLLSSPVGLAVTVAYVAVAAAAITFFPRETVAEAAGSRPADAPALPALSQSARDEFERFMESSPRVPLAIPSDGAKVLIVKFNDYQCPPCRQTYMEYKPILEKYQRSHPGQVKFVTMDFPLEAECNTGGVHLAACEAAAAVKMARAKQRDHQLEDWLFDNQPAMSPDLVRQGARQVGQVDNFDAQYPKVLEQVRADVALGRQLGVAQTPTFFINGVRVVGGLRPQYFEAAIEYELRRAAGGQ